MDNIYNYTNRQLCEYRSIFPTVAALLDHLLFTIGNGYDVNPETGMIEDMDGVAITDYPEMTLERWADLIVECHRKEHDFAIRFSRGEEIDQEHLAEKCAAYKPVSVDASAFSEESLYADLRKMVAERERERRYWRSEVMLRPYPLSKKYSDIYNLNENTPAWFLQIGINLCKAWVRFLNEELAAGRVWTPSNASESLIHELMNEVEPGSTDVEYRKPETDYADANWTTKHRDMLMNVQQKLETLLYSKS